MDYITLNTVSFDIELLNIRNSIRKYAKLGAVLLAAIVVGIAFYLSPSREEAQKADLAACKRKCAPLAGVMKGTRSIPNAPATDRRNHERFTKCVCR